MREITQGDICAATRVLLAHPKRDWPLLMAQMLYEAHVADCYRKRFGRAHPRLGTGSLMSVALARGPAPVPVAADSVSLVATGAVIAAVLVWRAERQRKAWLRDESPFPCCAQMPISAPWHKHPFCNSRISR